MRELADVIMCQLANSIDKSQRDDPMVEDNQQQTTKPQRGDLLVATHHEMQK